MKIVECGSTPKMGKWRLAWWRFKRLFVRMSNEYIVLDEYEGEKFDVSKIYELAHEYDMSLNEFANYILKWYIDHTTPEQMKKDFKEFRESRKTDKKKSKPLTTKEVDGLLTEPEPMKKKDYDELPVTRRPKLVSRKNINKYVDKILE